jgi:hypothetical protein
MFGYVGRSGEIGLMLGMCWNVFAFGHSAGEVRAKCNLTKLLKMELIWEYPFM